MTKVATNIMDKTSRSHRRSIRLKGINYTEAGAYYITICTADKELYFGAVENEQVELSPIGEIATGCWLEIDDHFDNVVLDEFVVMPNHIHGILFIPGNCKTGAQYIEPSLLD